MKFREIVKPWLARKEATVKTSSYANVRQRTYSHIVPKFGDVELDAIDEDAVQAWVGELAATGLAFRTYKEDVLTLANALRFAEKKGWRTPQGRMDVVFPRNRETEDDRRELALKPETCAALVEAVDEEHEKKNHKSNVRNHAGVILSLFTGLRIGEVCGLKWEDIDLDEGVIRVRRTVQRVYLKTPEGPHETFINIGSPKTRTSRRDVPICAPLRERLERMERPEDGEAYFLSGTRTSSEPRTLRESVDRLCARHGIEHFNFHRLRHTFATRCIEAGVDAKTTSELLGHANVNITLNLYVHPNAEAKRAAVDRMAAAFAKARGS